MREQEQPSLRKSCKTIVRGVLRPFHYGYAVGASLAYVGLRLLLARDRDYVGPREDFMTVFDVTRPD